jgi:hypothetical protein
MKTRLEQSEASLAKALELLAEVWLVYQEPHPAIAENVSIIMEGLDTAREAIITLEKSL